jgi:hypothetical protein
MSKKRSLGPSIKADFRRLGWTTAEWGDRKRDQIFWAETTRGGPRFRVLVHCLPAAEAWLFYRRPAKTVARPEPLAGIVPLALSSCNLPCHSQVFVRTNERTTFYYVEEGIWMASGRELLPDLIPVIRSLRGHFLKDYLGELEGAGGGGVDLFYLNLLVTDAALFTLHPPEVEAALASADPADLAWEAAFVPLHLPPSRLERLPGEAAWQEAVWAETLCLEGDSSFQVRLRYLLRQLPAVYWVVAGTKLEESLRFVLSYADRWRASSRS